MTKEEYVAEINRLRNELAVLRKAEKEAKKKQYVLPLELGQKYGGFKNPYAHSTSRLPFLYTEEINWLSRIIRGAIFLKEKRYTKDGKPQEMTKRCEDMTEVEYAKYLLCLDEILGILQKYTYKEETDGTVNSDIS